MNFVTLLFLAANPQQTERLALDQESRAIDEGIQESVYRERLLLADHWAVQVSDLEKLLLRYEPAIVHFSGHGTEASEILLVDHENQAAFVSGEKVAGLLRLFSGTLKCVFLNACYSEAQAQEIVKAIDCVIGVPGALGDANAITFSANFYRAIGHGKTVRQAFDLATATTALLTLPTDGHPLLLTHHDGAADLRLIEPSKPLGTEAGPIQTSPRPPASPASISLQQMAAFSPKVMMVILAVGAVAILLLIALPLLMR